MAFIKNIEDKIKISTRVTIGTLIFSLCVLIIGALFMTNQLNQARKTIYVFNNGVPIMAEQTDVQVNRPVEYKSHVDMFHSLYFNLTPDEKQIEYQMKKAMYLIDETGVHQYNNLKEKGYFTQILSSSAILTIQTDSVQLDILGKKFKYFGKQKIERKSSIMIRSLVTEGSLKDIPRSENNPHGIIIENWKTLENKDLEIIEKANL